MIYILLTLFCNELVLVNCERTCFEGRGVSLFSPHPWQGSWLQRDGNWDDEEWEPRPLSPINESQHSLPKLLTDTGASQEWPN